MRRALAILGHLVFVLLLAAAGALLVLNALAWRGDLVDDDAEAAPQAAAVASEDAERSRHDRGTAAGDEQPGAGERAPRSAPSQAPAGDPAAPAGSATPAPAAVSLTAAGGDSWVEVRARSAAGRQLFAGILERGRTLSFERAPLWINVGAARNVELSIAGERAELPGSTVTAIVSLQGVRVESSG